MSSDRARIGRCERGLNTDLAKRADIGPAERAALRAHARALDRAEAIGNARLVNDVCRGYLECRRAAGLVAGEVEAGLDPFAAFVAGLSASGVGDPAQS
jgi:hypothetical protein